MKLADAREHYYTFSGKLSDASRQLSFAGIAIVWIFAVKSAENVSLPHEMYLSLSLFVSSLLFDLLQYVYATAAWGIYHRLKEFAGTSESAIFTAPAWINTATLTFFWLKSGAVVIGFVSLKDIFLL